MSDILHSRIMFVILDVISDGFIEEDRLLTDNTESTSQVMDVVVLDIDAIYQDLS
jgi:hypothetical protein